MATQEYTLEQLAYMEARMGDDRTGQILGGAIPGIPIIILSITLRFLARSHRKASLLADDWLMLATSILGVTILGMGVYAAANEYIGKHVWAIPPEKTVGFIKGSLGATFLFGVALGLLRASILMMYLRLFDVYRSFKIQVWVLMVLNAAYTIAAVFLFLIRCRPLEKSWDPLVPGTCIDFAILIRAVLAVNVALDLTVFLLPVRPVMKLHTIKSRKASLCASFALGSGVCAIAVYRLVLSREYLSSDLTWDIVTSTILSCIELCGAVFCANVIIAYPIIAGAVKKCSSSITSLTKRTMTTNASGSKSSGSRKPSGSKRLEETESDVALTPITKNSASMRHQTSLDDTEALIDLPPKGIFVDRNTDWQISHNEK